MKICENWSIHKLRGSSMIMDQRIINAILILLGLYITATGGLALADKPGFFDYLSVVIGVVLIVTGALGLRKGKVL